MAFAPQVPFESAEVKLMDLFWGYEKLEPWKTLGSLKIPPGEVVAWLEIGGGKT